MEKIEDYFIVHGTGYRHTWFVSRHIALGLEQSMDKVPTPEWVTFVDLTGARIRFRTQLITCVTQCTAEQRALAREFERAREAELESERDWDEE